ncbi:YggS family pyridoxal phosphate-dependent enzyme [uncultured Mailhella sp.]|uniref:YggS family pyridoxal phosphate-dependent enzyme n=1 Tax=uncultured Mailhella sp. TaxID=1981031 RepID=UPI0025F39829|nr:YggS family pyridoxal phosphate-dependent enzyme [uncultured Mailhella sp.]
MNMTLLEERWRGVLDNMAEAVRRAGRKDGSVRLVAVSKFHPASDVAELCRLGQKDFGENYIQEARAKQGELAQLDIRWHAIGPVQTNKAREVAGHFSLLHTLDRVDLARALVRRLPEDGTQDVLIQVNVGEEPQKSGVLPAALAPLFDALLSGGLIGAEGPGLRVRGLMCLPPRCGEGEQARPYFVMLRRLRDDMEKRFGLPLPELSMGMSGDYREAIEEGATLIRVGTDIFGPRPVKGRTL